MGVLTATHGAKAGHPGGSLSAADMFTYLYFKELNIDPSHPKKPDRDRFVERIGINDEFGHSGSAGELLKQFGLCADHIVELAQKMFPSL